LNSFVKTFQIEDLRHRVLPELLVGIKDTDDFLVSTTLRALADLVPILGAATVIGGNRGKLFTDGRPNKLQKSKKNVRFCSPCKSAESTPVPTISEAAATLCLPERPSPDGGEDKSEVNFSFPEEENWSDWDAQETESDSAISSGHGEAPVTEEDSPEVVDVVMKPLSDSTLAPSAPPPTLTTSNYAKKPIISDISELDIKHLKPMNESAEDIDFFTDMEPVIRKAQILRLDELKPEAQRVFDVKLEQTSAEVDGDGWADGDLDDWDVENNC
jgi:SCY1-like protein 3